MTDKQASALARITEVVGSIGHREIAPRTVTDTGAIWAWFDHARFSVKPDGTFGSVRYGKQRNGWGMVVTDVRRPREDGTQ